VSIEVDAEKLRFTTDEGRLTYVRLDPPTQPDNYGNWDYSIELAWEASCENKSFKSALATLAEATIGKRGIPRGVIKKLEDTDKDPEKNKHLEGMLFSSFKKKVNPKDKNLADPQERKDWLVYVASQTPNLFKLDEQGKRHDAKPGDFRRGYFGRVIGHVYYQAEWKKFCITMEHIILTRKGELLAGGPIDPQNDRLLNDLAPAAQDEVDTALADADSLDELPF
jgi:hypothetical protein